MSPENKHTHTYTLSSTEKCIHGQSATIRLKLISSLDMYATQRTRPTKKGGRIYCASTLAYKWHRGCKGQGRNQRCVDSGKSPRCCTKKFKRAYNINTAIFMYRMVATIEIYTEIHLYLLWLSLFVPASSLKLNGANSSCCIIVAHIVSQKGQWSGFFPLLLQVFRQRFAPWAVVTWVETLPCGKHGLRTRKRCVDPSKSFLPFYHRCLITTTLGVKLRVCGILNTTW